MQVGIDTNFGGGGSKLLISGNAQKGAMGPAIWYVPPPGSPFFLIEYIKVPGISKCKERKQNINPIWH